MYAFFALPYLALKVISLYMLWDKANFQFAYVTLQN